MHKTLRRILLITSALFTPFLQAAEGHPMMEDNAQQTLEQMHSQSYDLMAKRYTGYAELFNVCQQFPEDSLCGDPFKTAESRYLQAKANHGVFTMMMEEQMLDLPLTPDAGVKLANFLAKLGYMTREDENADTNYAELLEKTNQWSVDHKLPETDKLYLLHLVLVTSDLMNVQDSENPEG